MSDSNTLTGGLWLSRSRIGLKIFLKHLLAPVGLIARQKKGLRVLFYHRVNTHAFEQLGLVSREISVRTGTFEKQMAYLSQRGYRSLTLSECHQMLSGDIPVESKAVLITFDDGYRDNLTDAAPILAKYGFTALVFPVVSLIGADNRAMPMGDPEGLGDFMSADELRLWLDQGHEIGSHTMTHPVLTHTDDEALDTELRQSREHLTDLAGKTCTSIAYPTGDVDDRVAGRVKAIGYDLGFTTQSGTSLPGADMALVKRTEVSISDTQLIFRLKMNGYFDWLGFRDSGAYRALMRGVNHMMRSLVSLSKNRTS